MRPILLEAAREDRARKERDKPLDELRAFVGDVGASFNKIDGYAVVVFERDGRHGLDTKTSYYVRDVMDLFRLPDLARVKIEKCINNSTEEV